MLVRRATADDMPAVAELHRTVISACLPFLPNLRSPEEDLRYFREHLLETCEIWVADEGAIIGYVAFRDGWVDHLYVRPQAHGRGIGTALLACAIATLPTFHLWAFQRNAPAIRFYLARGLRAVEHTDGSRNEEREPNSRFVWDGGGIEPMRLATPDVSHLPEYVAALLAGWSPSSTRDVSGEELAQIRQDSERFVRERVNGEGTIKLPDGSIVPRVPGPQFWLWDGSFCGNINFRHLHGAEDLPPHVSGHVGYNIVPWKRRRGYATRALAMILPYARAAGMRRVLLTCDEDNVASRKVIESNGGVLVGSEPTADGAGPDKLKFWVPTSG